MHYQLYGKRVLVVEDNPIIAYDISDQVAQSGAEAIGPALDLSDGLRLTSENQLDAALLDIELGDEYVWPIAEALDRHAVPYAFVSAQCDTDFMPEPYRHHLCIRKPARPGQIAEALIAFVAAQPEAAQD